jgi:hypothetical protein
MRIPANRHNIRHSLVERDVGSIAAGSRSHNRNRQTQQLKNYLGSKKVSSSIRPIVFFAGGWTGP